MLLVCSAVFLVSVHGVFVRLGVWLGLVGLEVLEALVPWGAGAFMFESACLKAAKVLWALAVRIGAKKFSSDP